MMSYLLDSFRHSLAVP